MDKPKQNNQERDVLKPLNNPVEGAYLSYELLKWVHPPTASALILGGIGGGYVGWSLLADKGVLAVTLATLGGVVLGAIVAVIAYWLFRLFAAIGN